MNSFVILFVPGTEECRDLEAALRKRIDRAESIDGPPVTDSATIEDAEQLPLWRWFTF
jgi:hypothetical protein